PERWRRYWQVHPDGTAPRLIHFIGKDNIVFHTLIFPAILMRLNDAMGGEERFVLPDNVPANEFLNLDGRKLSTSRGWAVWLDEALDAFPADALRYALATSLPETRDADFNWDEFQAHVNDELADVLGNFVHRALTFAQRFSGGEVPALRSPSDADREVLDALAGFPERIGAAYERFRFREAVNETMALARLGNKYFNDAEPWKTRTSDPQACANTNHVALQLCASLSVLMEPVLPHSAARLRAKLGLTGVRPSAPDPLADEAPIGWDEAGRPLLLEGHALGEPEVLFRKVEDEEIAAQRRLLQERAAEAAPPQEATPEPELPYATLAGTIAYEDFARLDLRAGRVLAAEPHPNPDKLLRLDG